eukprot:Nitzschia sp. Nitz4//scaffold247_size31676//30280//31237//NITZ4_007934-RA/size31676-augustus-gene-0.28-mRNA-1//1//CDS//3329543967//8114//frame0
MGECAITQEVYPQHGGCQDTDPKAVKYLPQPTFESALSSLEWEGELPTIVTPTAPISPDYVPTNTTTTTSQTEAPTTSSSEDDINTSSSSNPRTLKRKKTNLVVHEDEHHSVNKDHDDSSATSSLQDDDEEQDNADEKMDDDYDSLACQICLTRFQVGDKICWSHNPECVHTFHIDCLEHWLLDKDHCPLCRQPYLVPEAKDVTDSAAAMNRARVSENDTDIETGGGAAMHSEGDAEGVAVTCRLIPFAALVDRLSATIPRHHHCHATSEGVHSSTGNAPETTDTH